MASGKLEKMRIYAYNDPRMGDEHQVGKPFVAMMNPETYSVETKMEFNTTQGHGTSGSQPRFELKLPEEMSFEFLFDSTGIVDGQPVDDLGAKIKDFSQFLMGYDGESHEPKFFKLAWGTLVFKGRCTGLLINYKLFNPDGAPIRAICKVTIKQFQEENLRVAEENNRSPDLTHRRVVKKGDTLPLMCWRIYGDSRHYLEVARANGLSNFRDLPPGTVISFPPFAKAGA